MAAAKKRTRYFAFLPNTKFADDVPYVSFKAMNYRFFTGGAALVNSYVNEPTDADKEAIKQEDAEADAAKQIPPDEFSEEDTQKSLSDSQKQGEEDTKGQSAETTAANQQSASNSTKKKLKRVELVLPIQGGAIESLQANWGGANEVRLGLGVNFHNLGQLGQSIAAYTKRYLITEVINSAFKGLWKMGLHSAGQAFNEYIGMAYSAPEFRTYRFAYDLYPSNKAEADQLRRIIFAFKYFMSPKTDVGLTIDYPAMWEIDIVAPSSETGSGRRLMMIYYAALRNCTVNYEDEGTVVFHKDGEPVKNHIELEFVELNYVTRNLMEVEAVKMYGVTAEEVLDGTGSLTQGG